MCHGGSSSTQPQVVRFCKLCEHLSLCFVLLWSEATNCWFCTLRKVSSWKHISVRDLCELFFYIAKVFHKTACVVYPSCSRTKLQFFKKRTLIATLLTWSTLLAVLCWSCLSILSLSLSLSHCIFCPFFWLPNKCFDQSALVNCGTNLAWRVFKHCYCCKNLVVVYQLMCSDGNCQIPWAMSVATFC
jgi:hypothetical protein